ncbi:MAG: hypothetical protein OXB92_02775 [Acidimicrobiaceae bacterium]|nr:hypothetical protein [Acidimicrobiaceae bacterium]
MKLTEELRADLYVTLTELVGSNGAEFLMTQGPPGGWEQYPTKTDLQAVAVDMVAGFAAVDAKHETLRADMVAGFAAADAKHETLRADMVAGFAAADAKHETLRADMIAGFAAADAKHETLRADMVAGFAAAGAKTDALRADMVAGFAAIEIRIAELIGTRSRDVWAFSATVASLMVAFIVVVLMGT